MKYIIFNNELSAEGLNQRITLEANSEWVDGITSNYCILRKHPTQNLWAVAIDNKYINYFTEQEILSGIELTTDWKKQFKIG